MPNLLFVCTGNATRSVLAGALVSAARPDWAVSTAGTMVMEDAPMSWRTRAAMEAVGVSKPGHRSVQLQADQLSAADLVVGLATEHVEFIRRTHSEAAERTGTLRRLVRDLPTEPMPLRDRVAAMGLAALPVQPWEDIEDPAGQEMDRFIACAHEIRRLVDKFVRVLDQQEGGAGPELAIGHPAS